MGLRRGLFRCRLCWMHGLRVRFWWWGIRGHVGMLNRSCFHGVFVAVEWAEDLDYRMHQRRGSPWWRWLAPRLGSMRRPTLCYLTVEYLVRYANVIGPLSSARCWSDKMYYIRSTGGGQAGTILGTSKVVVVPLSFGVANEKTARSFIRKCQRSLGQAASPIRDRDAVINARLQVLK